LQVDARIDANVERLDVEVFGGAAGAYAFIGSVLNASTEYSIIATDLQGVIVLWNEGARRLYGYEPSEIIGQHKAALHTTDDARAGMPRAMMDSAATLGKWEGTVDRIRKDGTGFTARVVMTLRRDDTGAPVGFLLMSSDITEELRMTAELRILNAKLLQKLDELERSNRVAEARAQQLESSLKYKSEFLANMSHELRTPLNCVTILARVLGDNAEQNLTPQQIQYAGTIGDSGASLLSLLNDLLDLAEIGSAPVTAEISALALIELQDALQRDFGPRAAQKGVLFTIEPADDLPSHIDTDPTRLRQVLNHLIGNAVKFTERGAVRLLIRVADSGWSTTHAELSGTDIVIAFAIEDTGIGMTAETQRLIFEDFVQGDGTTARQYGGTGLGLSLSHKLTHVLGGEITVTSLVGQGSTFTLYIPATACQSAVDVGVTRPDVRASQPSLYTPSQAPSERSPAPRLSVSGIKALVVDDDPINVIALTALLEHDGVEVVSADNGEEAVAILERTPDLDVAFVDIMMPSMDGYETMGAMRKLPGRRDMAIYAVTAKVGNNEAQRCIDAGATAYMSKPVDIANLKCILSELLPDAPPAAAA
jgi:two-component system chemotaxis sensor kinase CheA